MRAWLSGPARAWLELPYQIPAAYVLGNSYTILVLIRLRCVQKGSRLVPGCLLRSTGDRFHSQRRQHMRQVLCKMQDMRYSLVRSLIAIGVFVLVVGPP